MKPLNTQERNSSFWSFVLFFTLCVILITGAVSLNFILPDKQFSELKIKVKDYASFKAKQSGFMSQIDEINKKLNYNTMLSLKSKLGDAKVQLSQANSALSDCEAENRKVEKELKDKQEKK